jgi:predicted flap endonuclease-1-like 5' DNA nuclease
MQVHTDTSAPYNQASPTGTAGGGRDDLERIGGIGPAYAKALHEAGIHRFADFAVYHSAAELRQALLERAATDVPLWKIESHDWLGQARKLAQESEPSESTRHKAAQKASKHVRPATSTTANSRRQHAGFTIFFDYLLKESDEKVWQTHAYHDESGEEKVFDGYAPEQWMSWVLEKAQLPEAGVWAEPAALPEPELVFVAARLNEGPRLDILAVELRESRPTFGILKGELCAKVKVRLWGGEVEMWPAEYPLRLELYLVNLTNRTTKLAASSETPLSAQGDQQQAEVTFDFPEAGRYELHTIALLLPPMDEVAVHRGPVITIIP